MVECVKKVLRGAAAAAAASTVCLPCSGEWGAGRGGSLSSYELGFHISSMAQDSYFTLHYSYLGYLAEIEDKGPKVQFHVKRIPKLCHLKIDSKFSRKVKTGL